MLTLGKNKDINNNKNSVTQRQPLLTIFYLSFQKLSVKIGVYVCVCVFHK